MCNNYKNIYNRALKYVKYKLSELKKEADSSTIRAGDFNTPFSIVDRTLRKKISKELKDLNNIYHLDLIDIYRALT